MKPKIFSSPDDEAMTVMVVAAVAMHGILVGQGSAHLPMSANIVDDSFDLAQKFIARAKELSK